MVTQGSEQVDGGESPVHLHILQLVVGGLPDDGITPPRGHLSGKLHHSLRPYEGRLDYSHWIILGVSPHSVVLKLMGIEAVELGFLVTWLLLLLLRLICVIIILHTL